MTKQEFNSRIEEFEIDMLEMPADIRFNALVQLTRDRHQIAGRTYGVTDLLVILEQLTDSYLNLALCRAISNHLYIYDN